MQTLFQFIARGFIFYPSRKLCQLTGVSDLVLTFPEFGVDFWDWILGTFAWWSHNNGILILWHFCSSAQGQGRTFRSTKRLLDNVTQRLMCQRLWVDNRCTPGVTFGCLSGKELITKRLEKERPIKKKKENNPVNHLSVTFIADQSDLFEQRTDSY